MPHTIDARLVSAFLLGLLALSCTSWSALAGTHCRKKPVVSIHSRYYSYYPTYHSFNSVSRPLSDDHKLCYLPSEGCDNNHSITN
jgi:hypothetical protein